MEIPEGGLRVKACHVTGTHDPTHTTKSFCAYQKAEAFDHLLDLLGVTIDDLPRIDDGWIRSGRDLANATSRAKEQAVREYAWLAGAPMAAFTEGSEVPQKGDLDILGLNLASEWLPWQVMLPRIQKNSCVDWSTERYWNVVNLMLKERPDSIEQRDISVRFPPRQSGSDHTTTTEN